MFNFDRQHSDKVLLDQQTGAVESITKDKGDSDGRSRDK